MSRVPAPFGRACAPDTLVDRDGPFDRKSSIFNDAATWSVWHGSGFLAGHDHIHADRHQRR